MAKRREQPVLPEFGNVLGFMRLIWAVDHGLQRYSKKMASSLGITGPQRLVVRILGRAEGVSPGALSEFLHLHPSTMTGILQRLEDRGAIRREVDASDSRRSRLFLTAEGRRLDVSVKGTIEEAVRHALSRCSAGDVAKAGEVLAEVAASLSRIGPYPDHGARAHRARPGTTRPRATKKRS
jgi:MarR family transcriptional regulator, organic hydroperoxide resistance regulator